MEEEDTPTTFAFADITKAYDNVNLDKLDEIIREMNPPADVLEEWQDELKDLKTLNMNVSGVCIKRSNGLPQGSELAPGLFNIYTTYILNHIEIPFYLDVAIFADNWVISGTISKEKMKEEIIKINFQLVEYNLEFTMNEVEIDQIKKIVNKPKLDEEEIEEEKKNNHEIKFLGVKWYISNKGEAWFDGNDYRWNLPNYASGPGFRILQQYKKFVIPKFRYYHTYLKIVNQKSADELEKWLIKKIRFKLQKELIYLKIPNELITELINPKSLDSEEQIRDKPLRKYLTYYLQKSHETIERNLDPVQVKFLEKIKKLAKLTKEKSIRFGIYQATNYLYSDKEPEVYFKDNKMHENFKQLKRTWMILDTIYFAVMAEKRISTTIFKEQENYMMKTARHRCYNIF